MLIKGLLSSRKGVIAFFALLFSIALLFLIILPGMINYKRPVFQYRMLIQPIDENAGDICIYEIGNSAGNLLTDNLTIRNYIELGGWKKNIDDCSLFLEKGNKGSITFENVNSINDEFIIQLLKGPDQGELHIISSFAGFSKSKDFFLQSEEYDVQVLNFLPGTIVLRNITDSVAALGIVSLFMILYLLVPNSFVKKGQIFISSLKFPNFQNLQTHISKIWNLLDRRNVAIIALFLLYFTGVLFIVLIINPMAFGPSHFGDEPHYWETALSLANGSYDVVEYHRYSPVYPLSLLPAFISVDPVKTYDYSKILNALYITSAIFPGYMLIRKFRKRNESIVVSTLLLLNPLNVVIPGRILTENLFYPLFLWSILFAFTKVFQKSKRNQIIESLVLGILLGILFLTRYIGLVLIPALLLVWWLKPFNQEKLPLLISKEKVIHFLLILLPLILILGLWVLLGVNEGLPVKNMFGLTIAGNPNPEQLSFSRLAIWTILYSSFTVLLASPCLVFLFAAISEIQLKKWNADLNRWLITLAIVISALLIACIRHSWRAGYNFPMIQKLQGRYILYFGPLFLITVFAAIKKTFMKVDSTRIFIFSSFLILMSYCLLYLGVGFLDKPIRISSDSPGHEIILLMGSAFVFYQIVNTKIISIILRRNKKNALFFTFISLFVAFYIYGNLLIINDKSKEGNQLANSQISHLLFSNNQLMHLISNDDLDELLIYYPKGTRDKTVFYWTNTLYFYRIEDFVLIEDNTLKKDTDLVFQASYNGEIINLRSIDEEEYDGSSNIKYSHGDNYYEFELEKDF